MHSANIVTVVEIEEEAVNSRSLLICTVKAVQGKADRVFLLDCFYNFLPLKGCHCTGKLQILQPTSLCFFLANHIQIGEEMSV